MLPEARKALLHSRLRRRICFKIESVHGAETLTHALGDVLECWSLRKKKGRTRLEQVRPGEFTQEFTERLVTCRLRLW